MVDITLILKDIHVNHVRIIITCKAYVCFVGKQHASLGMSPDCM